MLYLSGISKILHFLLSFVEGYDLGSVNSKKTKKKKRDEMEPRWGI
jgi:hypothetical protein